MKRIFLAAGLAVLFAASPASGADLGGGKTADEGHPTPPVNWSSVWASISGGYGAFVSDTRASDDSFSLGEDGLVADNNGFLNIDGLGAGGFNGEVQIGADRELFNNLILGAFVGVNLSDAEFSASLGEGEATAFDVTADYDWGGLIAARLGVKKDENTAIFLYGGYARAQLGNISGTFGGEDFNLDGSEIEGWAAGLQVEHAYTKTVRLFLDGRFTDYGRETLYADDDRGEDGAGRLRTITADINEVVFRVGLKAAIGGY